MVHPGLFFVLFNNKFTEKLQTSAGYQTWIIRVEGKHLTTTTTAYLCCFWLCDNFKRKNLQKDLKLYGKSIRQDS